TEGRDVLILLAHGPVEDVDLDAARLLGQVGGGDVFALERIQGAQQADGEGSRRPEPRPCRDVGHADELDGRSDGMQAQGFTDDGVRNVVDMIDALELGVLEEVVVTEGAVDGDEDIAVDRGGDHESPVLGVIRGEIGPPSTQGDAQRRPGDDHRTRSVPTYRPTATICQPKGDDAMLKRNARSKKASTAPCVAAPAPPSSDEAARSRSAIRRRPRAITARR